MMSTNLILFSDSPPLADRFIPISFAPLRSDTKCPLGKDSFGDCIGIQNDRDFVSLRWLLDIYQIYLGCLSIMLMMNMENA